MELSRQEKLKLGELLVKMRDSRQSEAQAIDEFLNVLAQNEVQEANVGRIEWQQKTGSKGPYEMATRELRYARDYDLLVKELEQHDGRNTRKGWMRSMAESKTPLDESVRQFALDSCLLHKVKLDLDKRIVGLDRRFS